MSFADASSTTSWSSFGRPKARAVPFVPQMEASECGAACLAMVLAAYGCHVPLAEVRAACNVSRDGATALDLVRGGERFALETNAYKIDVGELDEVGTPAILHWELNHFVVLTTLDRGGGAHIVDPAAGPRFVPADELRRAFTGIALVPVPRGGFVARKRRRLSLEKYRARLSRLRPAVAVMALSGITLELFGLAFPAGTQILLDYVVRPRQVSWLVALVAVLGAATLLSFLLSLARDRILHALRAHTDIDLFADVVSHMVRLPASFFQRRGIGDLANRVHDAAGLRAAGTTVVSAGFDAFLVVMYVALLFLYEPKLGAVSLGVHGVRVLVTLHALRSARASRGAQLMARARAAGVVVEAFENPEATKAFGAESVHSVRRAAAATRELNVAYEARMRTEGPQDVVPFLDALGYALLLVVGGSAVIHGGITIGVFAAFLTVEALLRRPAESVLKAVHELSLFAPALERLDDVFDSPPERQGGIVLDHVRGDIEFRDVSFRYSTNGPLLLDRISFRVRPGERVTLVGRSGSGKSTVLKLLLGLVEPTSGTIRVDGHDLSTLDLSALRRKIGAALPDGCLFDSTVYENLALGCDAEIDHAWVHEAAKRARIDHVVRGLPRGYATALERNGMRLSGGQRQRLALARAFARRPRILVLDEATSSLDESLDDAVHEEVRRLGITTLSAAHRLSAIRHADTILVLEGGKIVEQGSFADLVHAKGPFAELARALGAHP